MIGGIINGINLQYTANYIIDQDRKDNLKDAPDRSIIWCKTDYLEYCFNSLKDNKNNVTLITHCSDYAIGKRAWINKPSCIKKWFAQNVNYKHPDLIPVPIGIENHTGSNKGSNTDFKKFWTEAFDFDIKNKIVSPIFCNYRSTHPSRREATKILLEKNLAYILQPTTYKEFSETVKKYLFVASPRGNGIDCHRTWEALYFGCIPIVEKHFMYDRYLHLPIIQVNNWNDLTPELLAPYIEKYRNKQCFNNIEELTLDYWIKKIKNAL